MITKVELLRDNWVERHTSAPRAQHTQRTTQQAHPSCLVAEQAANIAPAGAECLH